MSTITALRTAMTPALQGEAGKTTIRAQIARVEKERSECVNCPSAKTLAGKQNIQSLDSEIKALKAQLMPIPTAATNPPAAVDRSPSSSALGGRIDVYA